ncbi:MAG: GIY-YIG nuclease family protein [Halobacteriaceae archaeon]
MENTGVDLPASEDEISSFVTQTTTDSSRYYVYVLECENLSDTKIRERAKALFPPKTKDEVREVLEEENPKFPDEFSESEISKALERESGFNPPSWVHNAIRAEEIYYVGYSPDVVSRIKQHIEGTESGGAYFTEVVPPTKLCEVNGYKTKEEALEAENEKGRELIDLRETLAYWF